MQVLGEEIFSVELVASAWPGSSLWPAIPASADPTYPVEQLQVLAIDMTLPLVLGCKAGFASSKSKGANKGATMG